MGQRGVGLHLETPFILDTVPNDADVDEEARMQCAGRREKGKRSSSVCNPGRKKKAFSIKVAQILQHQKMISSACMQLK